MKAKPVNPEGEKKGKRKRSVNTKVKTLKKDKTPKPKRNSTN